MFSHQVLRACTFAFLDGKQHVFVIGLGALQVREFEDGLRTIDAECTRISKRGFVDMVESGAKRCERHGRGAPGEKRCPGGMR